MEHPLPCKSLFLYFGPALWMDGFPGEGGDFNPVQLCADQVSIHLRSRGQLAGFSKRRRGPGPVSVAPSAELFLDYFSRENADLQRSES